MVVINVISIFASDLNKRDNEVKLAIARINGEAEAQRLALQNGDTNATITSKKMDIDEKSREFDEQIKLEIQKIKSKEEMHEEEMKIKKQQITKFK